jgi:hypothetical protein
VWYLTQAFGLLYGGLQKKKVSVDCIGRFTLIILHTVLVSSFLVLFIKIYVVYLISVLYDDSGLLPSLAGVTHVAIQLPVYENVKLYFAKRDNTTVDKLSPGKLAICSSGSKVAASIITYPHEVFLLVLCFS